MPALRLITTGKATKMQLAVVAGFTILFGIAGSLALDANEPVAVVGVAVFVVVLVTLVRLIDSSDKWLDVAGWVLVAFAFRCAVAAALYDWSLTATGNGVVAGDGRVYSQLAWSFALWLHGAPDPAAFPPAWGGYASLFGPFVYLAALVYYVGGLHPLLFQVINSAIGVISIVLIWDIGRIVFDRAAARLTAIVLTFAPSIVLFSALFLRDALALLLVSAALWAGFRFQQRQLWRWIVCAAVCIALMYSTRSYVAPVLFGVCLATVIFSPTLAGLTKSVWLATTTVAYGGALAIALTGGASYLPPISFREFEHVRHVMAVGANTSFSEHVVPWTPAPEPVVMEPTESTDAANPVTAPLTIDETPLPGIGRALIEFVFVFAAAGLVSRFGRSPLVASAVLGVVLLAVAYVVLTRLSLVAAVGGSELPALMRTISYLPLGFANVFLAPFPWGARRTIDLLTAPESLVWYVILCGAAVTFWLRPDVRSRLAPIAFFCASMFLILVLTEGNVGTLVRHRAMQVAPFVVLAASPSLLASWNRLRRWRLGWVSKRQRRSRVRERQPDSV